MEKNKKEVETRYSRADDYKQVFIHRIFGGEREDHFEMVVESMHVNAGESTKTGKAVVEVVDEVCLKMSPEQAKRTYVWLGEHIRSFERKFREIKLGEDKTE